MRELAALVLLAIGTLSFLFALVSQAAVRIVRKRTPRSGPTPPISVLKPLKGVDPDLFDNLASLARQDYPCFELVLGCEDVMDPALAVARRLQRAFPNVPITIVAGGKPIGHNPKVNNLAQLARAARFDWMLVSDADVRVGPHYLRALAAETADPRVALVSSVIAAIEERSIGATLDSLHMNGFIASSVCAAEVLCGIPCVVGKSMFFRKSALDGLGGLELVKDVLAEDYVLGAAFHAAGYRVALSGYNVRAIAGARTFRSFFDRHVRWAQMRRRIIPGLYLGEPLLLPTPWLVGAGGLALSAGRSMSHGEAVLLAVSAIVLAAKCSADAVLAKYLRRARIDVVDAALIPLKDLVMVLVWAVAWFKSTVEWRGNAFRIGKGSVLTPILAEPEAEAEQRAAH
jgi:ceramide glucosyltransferase